MTELVERLQRHPFARDFSAAQLATIAACATAQRFDAGTLILREGEPADALYLLLSGRVVLEQHVVGRGALLLETLEGGDMLGLSWLLPDSRWALGARATTETESLRLDARTLLDTMAADCPLGLAISRHMIEQLYQRLERVRLQRLDVYRVPAPLDGRP